MTAPELEDEIKRAPWTYPWRLRDGRELPIPVAELESVHRTRSEMIEERVRAALCRGRPRRDRTRSRVQRRLVLATPARVGSVAGRGARHSRRERAARRSSLRDHYGVPAERLEVRQADVFELDAAELGTYDVVFVLGLIYHVENPMGVLRLARQCTRGLCVIESQLTQQNTPIIHGNGRADELHEADGSFAVVIEVGDNMLASTGRVLSLVPNRAALVQMANMAGFEHVEFATALESRGHNAQYVRGDRAAIFAS